jgi:maltokinase
MIDAATLVSMLPDYLVRQRWYGAGDRTIAKIDVDDFEVVRDDWPGLVWALATVTFVDGGAVRYQVPVGLRPLEATERFLEGKGRGFLGDVDTSRGPALVYDALVDPELAIALLHRFAPDEEVRNVRPLNVEQSNTSVIYDERVILKLFRKVADGPNPDVEVTRALADVGFSHISAPVAEWHRDAADLAVLRAYLGGGAEGWALAQTSLRDLYDIRGAPEDAGGDFAPEASRLGQITAQMHCALAGAFGTAPADAAGWVAGMRQQLSRVPADGMDRDTIDSVYARVTAVADAGVEIRIHGDYHLGQTMRTDSGWYILDFEGEPTRPLDERRRPSSPLRDVAGMLRSFHYAAQVALLERGEEMDEELASLAVQWEQRNTAAFLDGYLDVDEIDPLLPKDDAAILALLDAFLLDKAVYEVAYELAHRPRWAAIPLQAIGRLVEAAAES